MTLKDKETIQRALGIIEGVAAGLANDNVVAQTLVTAVDMIDEALQGEGNKNAD